MPIFSDEEHRSTALYLDSLPKEFIQPGEMARLQSRIENLRQALLKVARFGDEKSVSIAEKALETDHD